MMEKLKETFSSIKRLKTQPRSIMSDARLPSSVIDLLKLKEVNSNEVNSEYVGKKDRRLAPCL